ncbi:MAG: CusA/CzcA family heavy metal efflux RND transporter [Cytophagales bacterium]
MIKQIISFSIRNKLIIALMTLALIIAGIWSAFQVPIDAVPDITNNQVQIISQAPNLSTEDIEQFITYPVELAVANLPGITEIRSISRFGLSVVTVVFEDDMGIYLPRQLVAEKLSEIKDEIPEGFGKPSIGPITTGLGEIYQYTLEVDSNYRNQYSLTELRSIQDWLIRRQMAMCPGVIEVNAFGGYVKQYEIAIDPNELNAMGISLGDIFRALEQNNQNTGSAYIEKDHMANFIRGEGLLRTVDDIENILVYNNANIPILIKDIAEVRIGHGIRYGAFTKNGQGEAVGGIILMMKGENSNQVIKNVKERMAKIEKSLPEGISIKPFLDRTKLIQNTTKTVATNLSEGALIVIFVLVFLLGNWRGGIIVASVIPLSLLFAFILMNVFDVWANLMSLGAIDFGIIVDGAVIIVEGSVFMFQTRVLKGQNLSNSDKDDLTINSSTKMMNAAFFGQLIILIVFLPILALDGIEGKMFKPMALTFIFAMMGVMLLCLTYVPMMSSYFVKVSKNPKRGYGDRFINWLEDKYESTLNRAMRWRSMVIISALILLAAAVFVFSRIGGEFIPKLDEGDIAFHDLLRPGSSLTEGIEVTTKVEKLILDNFPEAEQVLSRIGVSDVPIDLMPMDAADCFIILKPKNEWTSAESKEELIEKIKAKLLTVPGVNYEFTQPIEMRFNELMTGVREDLAIKLYGEDMDILATKAEEISALISNISGVGDVKVEPISGLPQITIKYNKSKLAQYGLNISDVNRIIESSVAGLKSGTIYEGERRFDLVIRFQEENRKDIEDIRNLFVNLPRGRQIPLRIIADINYKSGPMQISRDDTNRRTYVGVNVRGRDIQSLVDEISNKLDRSLDLPAGYFIRYGGTFENLQKATERLKIVVPISLALIFILIFFALGSIKQSAMIYIAIPLAAIGGVFSLWLRGMPFSISAGIGFIVLFGIAVLNGLVLISAWNELKEEGISDLNERIINGARRRIRPILLTASTDILGFLPMALSTSAGAEVQRPLATVVIGGMISATLLTLIVLPLLYKWIEEKKKMNLSAKPIMIALILIIPLPVISQNSGDKVLSLEQAIEIAVDNNGDLQASKNRIRIAEEARKGAVNLPKTDFGVQYGQYNSADDEYAWQLNQSFALPTVYSRLRQLANSEIESKKLSYDMDLNDLKFKVRSSWYRLSYLNEKLNILLFQDSLSQDFQRASESRYKTEASSLLEKMTAETQVMEISNRLFMLQSDIEIEKARLLILLNSSTHKDVAVSIEEKRDYNYLLDSKPNDQNPTLLLRNWEIQKATINRKAKSSRYLPEFRIGYFNNSLKGVPLSNGELAGSSRRFDGFQAGILIPVFYNNVKSDVRKAKLDQKIAEIKAEYFSNTLNNHLNQQILEIRKYENSLNYYQEKALPQARLIIKTAQKSYDLDAIGYLEYFQNVDRALQLKYEYLENLNYYNQAVIRLEYIYGK